MALVSLRNFVAPFQNKVHLGLLFFSVAIFAAFRAAGGALSLTVTTPRAAVSSSYSEENSEEEATPRRTTTKTRSLPNSLDDLSPERELSKLGLGGPAPSRAKDTSDTQDSDVVQMLIEPDEASAPNAKAQDPSDLEDIERRLGLR